MIMADKIIELRKKNGWSQEELAEQLHVSRQSVSKWEGAQSIPDLSKVIAMASLFDVSTDYLLRDEIESVTPTVDGGPPMNPVYTDESVRRVSMEESNAFLAITAQASRQISLGVMLCILSPIFLILLALSGEAGIIPLTGDQGALIGVMILMLFIAAAVVLFVKNGLQLSKYSYLEEELIDTEYGVTGMVKARKQEFEHAHMIGMTVGILLCVLSTIPILACVLLDDQNDLLGGTGVCLALVLIAIGVWRIVHVSIIWEGYKKLLEEGDYARKVKRSKQGLVSGIYWMVITAIYLAYSFWKMDWSRSWIIWPVAGVLYAVVLKVEESLLDRKGS